MGASLGEVCRVTRRLCRIIKIIKKKYLVSLLGRKLFRPPSYMEIVSKELKTSDTGAMVQASVLKNVSFRILINGFAMYVKP